MHISASWQPLSFDCVSSSYTNNTWYCWRRFLDIENISLDTKISFLADLLTALQPHGATWYCHVATILAAILDFILLVTPTALSIANNSFVGCENIFLDTEIIFLLHLLWTLSIFTFSVCHFGSHLGLQTYWLHLQYFCEQKWIPWPWKHSPRHQNHFPISYIKEVIDVYNVRRPYWPPSWIWRASPPPFA